MIENHKLVGDSIATRRALHRKSFYTRRICCPPFELNCGVSRSAITSISYKFFRHLLFFSNNSLYHNYPKRLNFMRKFMSSHHRYIIIIKSIHLNKWNKPNKWRKTNEMSNNLELLILKNYIHGWVWNDRLLNRIGTNVINDRFKYIYINGYSQHSNSKLKIPSPRTPKLLSFWLFNLWFTELNTSSRW